MKYLIFCLFSLNILISSCKKDDTACYVYTITSVRNLVPAPDSTYPRVEVTEEEECGIDEATAKQFNDDWFNSLIDTLSGGRIFTSTTTSVYRKK